MAGDLSRVSASKSGLVLSGCTAWANPDSRWYDESKRPPEDTQKRDDGVCFHERIAGYPLQRLVTRDERASAPIINRWLEHAYTYLETNLLPRCASFDTEVAIAINWESGELKVLGGVLDRAYPKLGPGWMYGTADIVAALSTGELYIADWKTGGTDGAEEQLLTLATAFSLSEKGYDYNKNSMRPVVISCLQVNEEMVKVHERPVTDAQLDSHYDSMTFAWEDIGKAYSPNPSAACTALYCPHLAYCKAISEAVRDASNGNEAGPNGSSDGFIMRNITDKPTTDNEAGEQMALVSAAKRQINYLIENAKDYVNSGGRVISGQFEWSDRGNGFRWGKRK